MTVQEDVQELHNKLNGEHGVLTGNKSYYEATYRPKSVGVSTPPEMRHLLAQNGWGRMYVGSLEERLDLEGFRMAGSSDADERLWEWWQANHLDTESGLAHTEALVQGRAFVIVSGPDEADPFADPDTPVIKVESPFNMFADTDPRTGRVRKALRVYKEENTTYGTLYRPGEIIYVVRGRNGWQIEETVQTGVPFTTVVALTNNASLANRKGCSEISTELRSTIDAASRLMMNLQAAAELMAVPQRLLFGVAQEALQANPDDPGSVLEAYFARIIAVEDSEAHAMQFAAAELRNFVDGMAELTRHAASYTGLPPQYLAYASDNPASAEAIRSSESRLVKKAERKAKQFGGSWEDVMRMALWIMDGEISPEARRMETIWRDPATPTYAAKADAVQKLYANGMGVIPLERARIDMGYSVEERLQMKQWDSESSTAQLTALLGGPLTEGPTNGTERVQPEAA